MLPQRTIARAAVLQIRGRLARFFEPRRIGFAGCRRRRIDLFQIIHRHRRLRRVWPFEIHIEIDGRNAAMFDLRDELAHLQAPVAQMHIACDLPSVGTKESLQGVADHRGTQMSNMHRLGHIRATEIDDDGLALARFRRAKTRVLRHRDHARGGGIIGHVEIDETRPGDLHLGEDRISLQPRRDLFGDRARILLGRFGRRQRAVALELREIRTIRNLNRTKLRRKPLRRERGARDRRQLGTQRSHC